MAKKAAKSKKARAGKKSVKNLTAKDADSVKGGLVLQRRRIAEK